MYFSGYCQVLCCNGHYNLINGDEDAPIFKIECFDSNQKVWICPICGAMAYWTNLVDMANMYFDNKGNYKDNCIRLIENTETVDVNKLTLIKSLAALLDPRIQVNVVKTYKVPLGSTGTFYNSLDRS